MSGARGRGGGMLVLTRRVGERVHIGDAITVAVLAVRGAGVSLGLEAPPSVPVLREEIVDIVRSENRRAALASPKRLAGVDALFGGGHDSIDG